MRERRQGITKEGRKERNKGGERREGRKKRGSSSDKEMEGKGR